MAKLQISKLECAEAVLLQPDDRNNIAVHHLEISETVLGAEFDMDREGRVIYAFYST